MPRYRLKEDQITDFGNITVRTGFEEHSQKILAKAGQEIIIVQQSDNSDLVAVRNVVGSDYNFISYIQPKTAYYETVYYTLRSNLEEIPEEAQQYNVDCGTENKPRRSCVYDLAAKTYDGEPFYCGERLNVIATTLNRFRKGDISMQEAYDTIVNDAILSKIFDNSNIDHE